MSSNQEIQFIHANGFPPSSYSPLLNLINNKFTINHFKLRPLLENSNPEEIKNWFFLFTKIFFLALEVIIIILALYHWVIINYP